MAVQTQNVSGVAALTIILTDASTQLFFTNAVDGQRLLLTLQQDSSGSRVVTSGNCPGIQQPSPVVNDQSQQLLVYNASTNSWNSAPPSTLAPNSMAPAVIAAAGAASKNAGLVEIGGGSATAVTLVAPTAGPPGIGDDGLEIAFTCITAHAHTLTTPANKIGGAYDTVTFAAVGDAIVLRASGGIWYPVAGRGTNTLSEV